MISRLFGVLLAFWVGLAPVVAAAASVPLTGAGSAGVTLSELASISGPSNVSFCGATGTAACLEGWSGVWRTGTPVIPDPDGGSPLTISASRVGYDASGLATTYTDTFTMTSRIRQVYPNQGTLPGSPNYTADLVSLSDYVYAPSIDTVGGGITNNSTLIPPKPICNWVTPHRAVVGNSITMGLVCAQRNARSNRQIAAAICRATDGTLEVSSSPVASTAPANRPGDVAGNAVLEYSCTVDITTLAAGLITFNAKAYPWIGSTASVRDSADGTAGSERDFGPRYFLKNTTLAASPWYVYVADAGATPAGNNTTCVASQTEATAAAAPCLTLGDAGTGALVKLNATAGKVDGGIIKINSAASFALGTPTAALTQNVGCVTITRGPVPTRAQAVVNFGGVGARLKLSSGITAPLDTGCVRFNDVQLTRLSTSAFVGEAAQQLEIQFDDVNMDAGGHNATWLSNAHDYVYGMAITNLPASSTSVLAAGTYEHRIFRALSGDLNLSTVEGWLIIGSNLDRMQTTVRGSRTGSGSIIAFSKFTRPGSAGGIISLGATETITEAAILQSYVEYTAGPTAGTGVVISADAATGSTAHVVVHHLTVAGAMNAARSNWFYDDGATRRFNTLHSCVGNLNGQQNTKGDVFRGVNEAGADAASATGNQAFLYGAGCRGEASGWIDASSNGLKTGFAQFYPGLKASIGASNTTWNDPSFTSYQATTYSGGGAGAYTAGAGGGAYTVGSSSLAKSRVTVPVFSHDLAGTARPSSNDTTGAYVAP